MSPKALRFIFIPVAFICVLAIAAVVVLAAPMFSQLRRSTVQDLLSREFGQPVVVQGDARIKLGAISRIHASGAEIPSQTMPDVLLAQLDLLELDLDLFALLGGSVVLNNLVVDGLNVRLLTDENGTTSWSDPPEPAASADASSPPQDVDLTDALRHLNFSFREIGLNVDDAQSGFEFEFKLDELTLVRDGPGVPPRLAGTGTLNDQPIVAQGEFPSDAPFALTADIAGITLDFRGDSDESGAIANADLSLGIASIGTLLDVLKLDRVADGQGTLQTKVLRQDDRFQLIDTVTQIDIKDGASTTITGSVKDLFSAGGIDLLLKSRLYPEGQPPAQAKSLKDFTLTDINARIVGDVGDFRFEDLEFLTNAIDAELNSIGPASVRQVKRTEDGQISLLGVTLQAGPVSSPYLTAKGGISDALTLSGFDISGAVDLPAALLLDGIVEDTQPFGRLAADFEVNDAAGYPSLSKLTTHTQGSDLWTFESHMSVGDITGLGDVDFSLKVGLPDVEPFITALGGTPSGSGELGLSASLTGHARDFETALGVTAGGSDLRSRWRTQISNGAPRLDGQILSDLIDLDELAQATASLVSLQKTFENPAPQVPQKKELLPLVLPDEDTQKAPPESKPALQPLVLPEENAPQGDVALVDLLDLPTLLKTSEANFDIKVAKISGQQGISAIDSALIVTDGKAKFGPLALSYGGGHMSVSAGMDFVDSPDWVSVSGETGGWDFGEILDAAGLGIKAYGTLSARFDILARYASLDAFLASMGGRAHVSLSNGKIETSLLELAGLGVIPWLFSKENAQGYTKITCLEAPLGLKSGRVSSKTIVAETEAVQVVASGYVDLKNDQVALRIEPRPLGKANARSPVPVQITGPLSKPNIDIKPGGAGIALFGAGAKPLANRVRCKPDAHQ